MPILRKIQQSRFGAEERDFAYLHTQKNRQFHYHTTAKPHAVCSHIFAVCELSTPIGAKQHALSCLIRLNVDLWVPRRLLSFNHTSSHTVSLFHQCYLAAYPKQKLIHSPTITKFVLLSRHECCFRNSNLAKPCCNSHLTSGDNPCFIQRESRRISMCRKCLHDEPTNTKSVPYCLSRCPADTSSFHLVEYYSTSNLAIRYVRCHRPSHVELAEVAL